MDWTGGLTLKFIFMLSNDTHSPVGLCGNLAALFLATHMVPEHYSYCIHEGLYTQCVVAFSSMM